jgi:hypothetical protein
MSDEKPTVSAKTTCCLMRRKVIVGVVQILTAKESGVSDVEEVPFYDFNYTAPAGMPTLRAYKFAFCPWCGKKRDDTQERRTHTTFVSVPGKDEGTQCEDGGTLPKP